MEEIDKEMNRFPICNHKKETAPQFFGKTFVFCWRCSGVYLAFLVMAILRLAGIIHCRNSGFLMGITLCIPMSIDGGIQYFFKVSSNNIRRGLTGFLFGVGLAMVIFCIY